MRRRRRRRLGCWWWWWWGPPSWPEVVSNSTRQASTAASQARWAASRSPDHPLTTGANNYCEVGTFELIVKESKSFKVIYSSCGGQSASFIFCLPLVRNIISYQFGLDEILLSFIWQAEKWHHHMLETFSHYNIFSNEMLKVWPWSFTWTRRA